MATKIDTVRTANTATDDPTEMARGDLYSKIPFCPMMGGSAMKQQITVFLTFCERLPNSKRLEVKLTKKKMKGFRGSSDQNRENTRQSYNKIDQSGT